MRFTKIAKSVRVRTLECGDMRREIYFMTCGFMIERERERRRRERERARRTIIGGKGR